MYKNQKNQKLEPLTVSVILTNYNHGEYLKESLEAILNQTRKPDQIIVIDDGSTDDSLSVIEILVEDRKVLLLKNKNNEGVQYSITKALKYVTSDYLVWAAADDKLMENFLERNVACLEKNRNIGISFSLLTTFDDSTGVIEERKGDLGNSFAFYIGDKPNLFTKTEILNRLEQGYLWISGNTVVVNVKCLKDVGYFIPTLEWHSDWFAFYAVALRYGAVGIPETLCMMRVKQNTYSKDGMNNPIKQSEVIANLFTVLRNPRFDDIRRIFRARPSLLSPFSDVPIKVTLRNPRDWDFLVAYSHWFLSYRLNNLVSQYNAPHYPTHIIKHPMHIISTKILLAAINVFNKSSWRKI